MCRPQRVYSLRPAATSYSPSPSPTQTSAGLNHSFPSPGGDLCSEISLVGVAERDGTRRCSLLVWSRRQAGRQAGRSELTSLHLYHQSCPNFPAQTCRPFERRCESRKGRSETVSRARAWVRVRTGVSQSASLDVYMYARAFDVELACLWLLRVSCVRRLGA